MTEKSRGPQQNLGAYALGPLGKSHPWLELLVEAVHLSFVNCFVFQIEELGCEGKVEEAQGVMKLCDQLKEEREQLENVSALVYDLLCFTAALPPCLYQTSYCLHIKTISGLYINNKLR